MRWAREKLWSISGRGMASVRGLIWFWMDGEVGDVWRVKGLELKINWLRTHLGG